ncbi:MAG TPA: BrnT family toxin [Candidatus Binataceae bacterium]|nr:BrnT family toxin [Candidatus Binataceae bacterium]
MMRIEFDAAKNQRNIEQRGISFALAAEFDWTTALVLRSDRAGETRYMAMGALAGRLHVLVYTMRGQTLRIISLRRANKREVRRYEKAKP